jgi:hypothetical protein
MGKKVIVRASAFSNISYNRSETYDMDELFGEGWEMSAQIRYELDKLAEALVENDIDTWWNIVDEED